MTPKHKTLIIIDFQPEYFVSYKTKIKLKEYLTLIYKYALKKQVIYLYNSIDDFDIKEKVLGESINEKIIKEWLKLLFKKILKLKEDTIKEVLKNIKFYNKGYGFLRNLMPDKIEKKKKFNTILKYLQKIYQNNKNNNPHLIEISSFLKKNVKYAIITGAYLEECVAEIIAILKSEKIPFKILKKYTISIKD